MLLGRSAVGARRGWELLMAGLVAAALLAPAAPAQATTFGVNYFDFADSGKAVAPEAEVAAIEDLLGARVQRVSVHWSSVQPAGPTDWNWKRFDEMYAAALARGIRPLLLVSHAPGWAWPSNQACGVMAPSYGDNGCNVPPDISPGSPALDRYRIFIRAMVERYPEAAGVEVWNEPNTDAQWQTTTAKSSSLGGSPFEYTIVLRATYSAVQAAEEQVGHDIPVITGGMHLIQSTDKGRTRPLDWMSALYANGAGGAFDRVGYHAYTDHIPAKRSAFVFTELQKVEDLVAARDPANPKVWVTETGYSTSRLCWVDLLPHSPCTEADQARGIPIIVDLLASDPQVEAVLVFTLFEIAPGERPASELGYGLVRRDLSTKPAYCVLARHWTGVDPCAADPDRDGVTDLAEAELGTDPNNPDTDGDGTKDGFDSAPLDPTRAGTYATAPEITEHPPEYTTSQDVAFGFSTPLQRATFMCKLDGMATAPCSSPQTYSGLTKNRTHNFWVWALDADGVAGRSAQFTVNVDQLAPDTRIKSGPFSISLSRSASFAFASNEPGTFECSLDGADFSRCGSPASYPDLLPGGHAFSVRAIDRAGNVDATPAVWRWMIVG